MINFKLHTLSGTKFDEPVYEISLPTPQGEISVLPNHMPLVSVASEGVIKVRKSASDRDDQREIFAISGGVIQVEDNGLSVLVDEADHADEINEAEVQKAFEQAKKMRLEAKDQVSLDLAQSLMDRSSVRLQVANLKRRSKTRP
jgi:F-type H+-transporting ATPase subunit epsilon